MSAPALAYVIITPIPPDYAPNVTPQGYMACYMTKTGSYKGIWSGGHQVCQYNIPGQEMWVSGYWQCYQYTSPQGVCTGWKWVLPQWTTKDDVQLEPDMVIQSGWHIKR